MCQNTADRCEPRLKQQLVCLNRILQLSSTCCGLAGRICVSFKTISTHLSKLQPLIMQIEQKTYTGCVRTFCETLLNMNISRKKKQQPTKPSWIQMLIWNITKMQPPVPCPIINVCWKHQVKQTDKFHTNITSLAEVIWWRHLFCLLLLFLHLISQQGAFLL